MKYEAVKDYIQGAIIVAGEAGATHTQIKRVLLECLKAKEESR